MPSTVQGQQIPSFSTVSALKATLCGSVIVFSVNVGSACAIKTSLRSTKPDKLFDVIPLLGYKVVSSVPR